MNEDFGFNGHLGHDLMAAMAAGVATGARFETACRHLETCLDCRDEAVAVRRLLTAHRWALRRRVFGGLGAALAAVAVLAVALQSAHQGPAGSPRIRSESPEAPSAPVLEPLAPLGPTTPVQGQVTFRWRAVEGVLEYRLTLVDEEGRTVWTRATADTVAAAPLELSLVRGLPYYWLVDALLPDGSSVTTGAREFRILP